MSKTKRIIKSCERLMWHQLLLLLSLFCDSIIQFYRIFGEAVIDGTKLVCLIELK